jgi:cold shock CspA family protein
MSSTDSQTETTSMTHEGRVKWFNNKAGYGFISVIGGENDGMDVFAHHSAIQVSEEQYKYLVQGEYLEFNLSNVESKSHKYQASDIRGVKGGKLLCETRNENRSSAPRSNRSNKSKKTQTRTESSSVDNNESSL